MVSDLEDTRIFALQFLNLISISQSMFALYEQFAHSHACPKAGYL